VLALAVENGLAFLHACRSQKLLSKVHLPSVADSEMCWRKEQIIRRHSAIALLLPESQPFQTNNTLALMELPPTLSPLSSGHIYGVFFPELLKRNHGNTPSPLICLQPFQVWLPPLLDVDERFDRT